MAIGESDEMAEAAEKLLRLSEDEHARAYVDSLDHAKFGQLLREQDKFDEGLEQGLERGIDIGRVEEKIEIAKNLLKMGISICDVSKGTGLSIEEIEKLNT